MCYQCSGCGRCLEFENADSGVLICPCCHREVEVSKRSCPVCGAFIRPRAGSVKVEKTAKDLEELSGY